MYKSSKEKTAISTKDCPRDCDKPLTVFAKVQVQPDKTAVFEDWFHEITRLQRSFKGYISSELIRPACIESNEFISIFRYDNYSNLQTWMTSPERQAMIERIHEFSNETVHVHSYHSLEHWFVPSEEKAIDSSGITSTNPPPRPPAKYKMWLVTTAVIYAQTQWVPRTLNRILPTLDPRAFDFITVMVIVAVAQFIVFPIVTRLLAFWLFPSQNYREKLLELAPSCFQRKEESIKGLSKGQTSDSIQSDECEHGREADVPV